MTREELDNLWSDPRNRKWGLVYYCPEDPRVIVPKRSKWLGWTPNFAHPVAIPVTLLLVALAVVPVLLVIFLGAGETAVTVTVISVIAVLCMVCSYLASRRN